MDYTRKKWVDVPDPKNPPSIPEGQDALARFDAANMNRIENGIFDAHNLINGLTADDLGAISKTKHLKNIDVLSIAEDGWYYAVGATNVPTPSATYGYIRVCVADVNHRVIYWRPASSSIEYVNIMSGGAWLGWTETFTNKGGMIYGYLGARSERTPGIEFHTNKHFSRIIKNASDDIDMGLLLGDFADNTNEQSSANLILSHKKALSSLNEALQFVHIINGKGTYYNIFGEHNKPSGSYTGESQPNDGKERIIDIGGQGECLLITYTHPEQQYDGMYLVSSAGMLSCINAYFVKKDTVNFKNGKLYFKNCTYCNQEGVTYYYQVL